MIIELLLLFVQELNHIDIEVTTNGENVERRERRCLVSRPYQNRAFDRSIYPTRRRKTNRRHKNTIYYRPTLFSSWRIAFDTSTPYRVHVPLVNVVVRPIGAQIEGETFPSSLRKTPLVFRQAIGHENVSEVQLFGDRLETNADGVRRT